VAQDLEQRLARFAQELDGVAVERRRYMNLGHQSVLRARSSAISAARRAITPATLIRYTFVPRLSSIGRHAALTAAAIRFNPPASILWPIAAAPPPGPSGARSPTAPMLTAPVCRRPLRPGSG